MPRRKQNILIDVLEISSFIPWWISLLIAVISYLLLSMYVGHEVVVGDVGNSSAAAGSMITSSIFKGMATIGQYIVPLVFIFGAMSSIYQRKVRSGLLSRVSNDNTVDTIDSMSWREFEMLVGEAFRKQGYQVKETPSGPDGGVDLVLSKSDKKILVQCKHWKAQKVGVKTVRELYGVLVDSGANEVNIVCSGVYTEDAKAFVKDKPIYLINGSDLLTLIENTEQN